MSDQFHQQAQSWSPYQLFLGAVGTLSHWWAPLVDAINALVANIAYYGGAFLIAWQVGRIAVGAWIRCRQKWGRN